MSKLPRSYALPTTTTTTTTTTAVAVRPTTTATATSQAKQQGESTKRISVLPAIIMKTFPAH